MTSQPVKEPTFCEPPGADLYAVVVWGELERDQLLPDLAVFIPIPLSKHELRSHPRQLDLRQNSS